MARTQHQINLPPAHLQNTTHGTSARQISTPRPAAEPLRRNSTHEDELRSEQSHDAASALAARLFNQAVDAATLTNKEIASLCGVSESLVGRWRAPHAREQPSLLQMLLLPPSFHLHMNKAINNHYGFGRAAMTRLLEAMGDVALMVAE